MGLKGIPLGIGITLVAMVVAKSDCSRDASAADNRYCSSRSSFTTKSDFMARSLEVEMLRRQLGLFTSVEGGVYSSAAGQPVPDKTVKRMGVQMKEA